MGMAAWTLIPDKVEEEETQVAQRFGVFGATLGSATLLRVGSRLEF